MCNQSNNENKKKSNKKQSLLSVFIQAYMLLFLMIIIVFKHQPYLFSAVLCRWETTLLVTFSYKTAQIKGKVNDTWFGTREFQILWMNSVFQTPFYSSATASSSWGTTQNISQARWERIPPASCGSGTGTFPSQACLEDLQREKTGVYLALT